MRSSAASGIERVRRQAGKAEDHRPVGGMPLASVGEGAVKACSEPHLPLARLAFSAHRESVRRLTIGPMVWELDGPMPILKMSNTLMNMII